MQPADYSFVRAWDGQGGAGEWQVCCRISCNSAYCPPSQIEVDFVLGDRVAIEVKGSGRVSERDAKPLHALAEDAPIQTKIIVCSEPSERLLDSGVRVMPVPRFVEALWSDAIVEPGGGKAPATSPASRR